MTVDATLKCAEGCVALATGVASRQAPGEPGGGQGQVPGDPARVRLAHVHGRGRPHRGAGAQVTWQPRACGARSRSAVPAVRGPAQFMRWCMLRQAAGCCTGWRPGVVRFGSVHVRDTLVNACICFQMWTKRPVQLLAACYRPHAGHTLTAQPRLFHLPTNQVHSHSVTAKQSDMN